MEYREAVIFTGERFQVPDHIQRIDKKGTHGWQLRYGKWKMFSDHTADGSGAESALAEATAELIKRVESLQAPSGLRTETAARKQNGLPLGISGPISQTRPGRRVAEYNFGVTVPRFGERPTTKNVYIGTDNTITDERFEEALAKAVDIRAKAVKAFRAAATKTKRAEVKKLGNK